MRFLRKVLEEDKGWIHGMRNDHSFFSVSSSIVTLYML